MGRLFFLYRAEPRPAGGLKQLRLMAGQLAALGREVYLLRERPLSPSELDDNMYYGADVAEAPFTFADARSVVRPDDAVILPEYQLAYDLARVRGWPCRVGVNNQNGFYALESRPQFGCRHEGVAFVLANAPYNAAVSNIYLGMSADRIFLVPHLVVRGPFTPPPAAGGRRLAVCFMPRKRADHIARIRELVGRAEPDVPWVELNNLPEPEVAARFRANAVFLSTQQREGCPLPSLEAMACGTVVAGYPGTERFPHPYATPGNGFWTADGDIPGAVTAVRRAITLCRAGGPPLDRLTADGRRTAERYSEPAVRAALRPFLDFLDGTPVRPARRVGRLGLRGHLTALRLLRRSGRLYVRETLSDFAHRTGVRPSPTVRTSTGPLS